MVTRRHPDFEPVFGSRPASPQRETRLRDRSERTDAVDEDGSVSNVLDELQSPRAVRRGTPTPNDSVVPSEGVDARERPATPQVGATGTRRLRIRRRLTIVIGVAIVVGLVYFLVTLLQVWTTGRADDEGPADAIVVMGAAQYDGRPSPQLAARLDHVLEIWPSGVAPLVVVTGGNIPGDRFTEAEASADYLTERGIPLESLLMENAGTTSQESLTSVADMLTARGLDEVVIVTDPYHALRSRLIAEEVGLDAEVSSTDTSVVTGFDSIERHVVEAGGVAIGRIIGFDRLADLTD